MKKRTRPAAPAVGSSALPVIFGILLLTVFALLSLSTVRADRQLSDAAEENLTQWYDADRAAQEILARLRQGELPPEVSVTGDQYSYTCPISRYRQLEVMLLREEGGFRILSWRETVQPPAYEEGLPVWNGQAP